MLRALVRRVVREELGLVSDQSDDADGQDDVAQLAAQRAAKLRRARSKDGSL
jgi:hypothetical protein